MTESKVDLFTPWQEFIRYEKNHFRRDYKLMLLWATIAVMLSIIVPWGQGKYLLNYLTYHVAMTGFGATVFGFTILGGKDDFFEPIIKEKRDGINTLRNMVLFLFTPLILHMIALGFLFFKLTFPIIGQYDWTRYVFRLFYSFAAIWATAQTFFSYRFLFILAITRLVWKYQQVYHPKNK